MDKRKKKSQASKKNGEEIEVETRKRGCEIASHNEIKGPQSSTR